MTDRTEQEPPAEAPEQGGAADADQGDRGRLLGGKYRLGRMIGEGGMGAVYEAEHTGLGVQVAIKLLNEAFTTDAKALHRFNREARATAAIKHPNIVDVTDTGSDEDGVPYIVMELLAGESLSSLLRREKVFSPAVAAMITGQMLSGLAAAHAKGVIHRDLKPGNILICQAEDGSQLVKVLDFGISKFFQPDMPQDVTAAGAVIGTPRFMAPEQAIGNPDIDARVDIYAVGVLLYRMVTGRLPFTARTSEEVIREILQGNPTPPRRHRPELPEALEQVILRAMEVKRDDRFADAREFYFALQQAVPEGMSQPLQLGLAIAPPGGPALPPLNHTGVTGATFPPPGLNTSVGSAVTTTPRGGHPDVLAPTPTPVPGRRRIWALPLVLLIGLGGGLGWYLWSRSVAPPEGGSGAAAPAADQGTGPALYLGITRYMPKDQLAAEHAGMLRFLSDRMGLPVRLRIEEDYIDLSARLTQGELHVAALSSYAYVRAKRRIPGLRLLATHVTRGGRTYEGFIVARAQDGIRKLEDLQGKVFCYVSPTSTSGYLYPRAIFRRRGLDPERTFKASRFTGDHLSALRALASGACQGAAVFAGILYEAPKHGMSPEQFTVLATTDRIPYDAYCASPSLPDKQAQALQTALLALKPKTPLTRRVLGPNSRIRGFAAVNDEDYDPVRKIEKYLDNPSPGSQGE